MIKIKPIFVLVAVFFIAILMIPTLLVLPSMDKTSGKLAEELPSNEKTVKQVDPTLPAVEVAVYRVGKEQIDTLPFEEYLVGVVAAEMPADFNIEALKAQAVTARTYTVYLLMNDNKIGVPEGADLTDTENHQVYKSEDELKELWGAKYQSNIEKIKQAVAATQGQILTYEGDPIYAAFFSTSNGYTENAEDYWSKEEPYLKSVQSPWDVDTPQFKGQKIISVNEFQSKLGVKLSNNNSIGTIIEKTEGNRVGKVNINGKILTGKNIREKLELKSTDFTWERKGNNIVINTRGYGHGVGMSQYGANGMASEGKSYEEIVQHYYKGTEISSYTNMLAQITAKK